MRRFANIIAGFVYGLMPVLGAAIFAIAIYAALPNVTGFIIIGVLVVLACWLGVSIFKKVQIVGPIEFITHVHASPDLDNLEPVPDSKTKRRSASELVELINAEKHLFKKGTMRIFGDWLGKPFDNEHKLISATYDKSISLLTLMFSEDEKLEIRNPEHILEASTFLKIINAERIQLSWYKFGEPKTEENYYFLSYTKIGEKIETHTDVDWYKPKFDTSLGDSALIIYG